MQEEIENRTVNLAISTTRLTANTLIAGFKKYMQHRANVKAQNANEKPVGKQSIKELIDNHMLDKDYYAAVDDYNHAVLSGIVKIASKMGISTIQSYQGSKIFEAIGIDYDVINKYFTDTVCRVGGISLEDIAKGTERRHNNAFDQLGLRSDLSIDSFGDHGLRSGGEEHLYNPATIHLLQKSTQTGDYSLFREYCRQINEELGPMNLRGLMAIK